LLLVLTESFHPGWQRCDGAPCATVRVRRFLAVVEPGSCEVDLRFAPASVELDKAAVLGLPA
jgi:hypothetical protein